MNWFGFLFVLAFAASSGYAAGRLHEKRRQARDGRNNSAYRAGLRVGYRDGWGDQIDREEFAAGRTRQMLYATATAANARTTGKVLHGATVAARIPVSVYRPQGTTYHYPPDEPAEITAAYTLAELAVPDGEAPAEPESPEPSRPSPNRGRHWRTS